MTTINSFTVKGVTFRGVELMNNLAEWGRDHDGMHVGKVVADIPWFDDDDWEFQPRAHGFFVFDWDKRRLERKKEKAYNCLRSGKVESLNIPAVYFQIERYGDVEMYKFDNCKEDENALKILYIHGLQSSGKSRTSELLRKYLPGAVVYSPDIPIRAYEAKDFIEEFIDSQQIDVVVGTSMGGMLAQLVRGVPKVIVNPSFHVSESMRKKIGTVPFLNEREDGAVEFKITEELCNEYELLERSQFDGRTIGDENMTYAIFGADDDIVDCKAEFIQHYSSGLLSFSNAWHVTVPCGHRLTEEVVAEFLVPMVTRVGKYHEECRRENDFILPPEAKQYADDPDVSAYYACRAADLVREERQHFFEELRAKANQS